MLARPLRRAPPSRARLIFALALALAAGCAPAVRPNATSDGRLRFVASQATQATWSFRVDDRARGGELLVDGRPRDTGCTRAGREIRCELRGLFPGGHVVELRLPGALLRRSVLIGKPWPRRPLLVRASGPEEAVQAIEAGADGVVLDARAAPSAADLSDLVDVVHAHSARAVVAGDARAIETAGADALLGDAVPDDLRDRFPEARTIAIDPAASAALAERALDRVLLASGVVETHGIADSALALAAPHGAIVDHAAFPLLTARKRHAALRTGAPRAVTVEPDHLALELTEGRDRVLLYINAGAAPWTARADVTVAAHDVTVAGSAPIPDATRY